MPARCAAAPRAARPGPSRRSVPVVVRRTVREQVVVRDGPAVLTVVTLVAGGDRQHVAEHLLEAPAYLFGQLFHHSILPGATMGCMGLSDKARELADKATEKAGELAGKAGELAGKATEKAGELSGTAREKAPGYLDRAAELAGKAVETAASGVDKATGGRFHDQLDTATTKVGETLGKARTGPDPAAGSAEPPLLPGPAGDASGQAGAPITPATTNPEAGSGQEPKG